MSEWLQVFTFVRWAKARGATRIELSWAKHVHDKKPQWHVVAVQDERLVHYEGTLNNFIRELGLLR
jgi:hypothetical protein